MSEREHSPETTAAPITASAAPQRAEDAEALAEASAGPTALLARVAAAGAPLSPPDGAGALAHPTAARGRIAVVQAMQRRRGNFHVRRAMLGPTRLAKTPVSVGPADSPAEREAERVAASVARHGPDAAPCSGHCECSKCRGRRNAVAALAAPDAGTPLPAAVRARVEPALGADLSHVRVHTSAAAGEAASRIAAKAFTHGNHIWLGPSESPSDARLMAHEATHVMQQEAAGNGVSGPPLVQRSPASDLIDEHTSWADLDEERLGATLLQRARAGEFSLVGAVFDELGWSDRDDVAYELTRRADDAALDELAGQEAGRRLLDRLYDELTAGSVADEESREADRILSAKSRRIAPEDFEAGTASAMIFPFKRPGITVLSDAPIFAERLANGRVRVEMPVRVLGTEAFRAETRTLPTEVFLSGLVLPENQVIGVKMYDLGGEVHYRPALYLVRLANETDTATAEAAGEAVGLGLTLGTGSLAAGGARAAWWARAAIWADRAATVIGTLSTVIREHRGWIIERFGASGRTFLRYVDIVNSAVALYGGGRALIGLGQTLNGLRRGYQSWRRAAQAAEDLSDAERQAIRQINQETDDLLDNLDEIDRIRPDEAAEGAASGAARSDSPRTGVAGEEPDLPATSSTEAASSRPRVPNRLPGLPRCRVGSLFCPIAYLQQEFTDLFDVRESSEFARYIRGMPEVDLNMGRSLRRSQTILTGDRMYAQFLREVPPGQWAEPFADALARARRPGDYREITVGGSRLRWPLDDQGAPWVVHHDPPLGWVTAEGSQLWHPMPYRIHDSAHTWWSQLQGRVRSRIPRDILASILEDVDVDIRELP